MSWDQLLTIQAEAAELDRQEAAEPPTVCPVHQIPLRPAGGGVLFCPFAGDYEYPRDGNQK
ncbi:hypothetical protein HUN42_00015 [Streptomyces phage Dagobah]|nr:hypothetical protein HUN42_00015 [Streptomyces phage Dagobah]